MTRKLRTYTIIGIVFTCITGTLLHFLYEWSGYHALIGIISPINESTWEHLKLLFYPMAAYSVFLNLIFGKSYRLILESNLIGLFCGLVSIPVLFYTYSGVIGSNYLWMDILIFLIGVAFSFFIGYYLQTRKKLTQKASSVSVLILLLILFMFLIFTFYQPPIGLFHATET